MYDLPFAGSIATLLRVSGRTRRSRQYDTEVWP
jgi:hypothetical protein